MNQQMDAILGELLDEDRVFSLRELCICCGVNAEQIIDMVSEGLIVPSGPQPGQWRFSGPMVKRVQTALRLQRDLGINLEGAALAVDLLEELERLRRMLNRYDIC